MITDIEQNTLDITWFFTNGEYIGFVASGGGKLPVSIANGTMEAVEVLANYFEDLPTISDIIINPNSKKLMTSGTEQSTYLSYFAEIARKGLFTFDKIATNNFSDTNYLLVAKPLNPTKFNELPLEIAEILIKTKATGSIPEILDIGSFD
jgi:hypothetical protein